MGRAGWGGQDLYVTKMTGELVIPLTLLVPVVTNINFVLTIPRNYPLKYCGLVLLRLLSTKMTATGSQK